MNDRSWNPLQVLRNSLRRSESSFPVPDLPEDDPRHHLFLRQMQKELRQTSGSRLELATLEAVVVDLETTGFYPDRGDEIIAIGAVAVCGVNVCPEESFFTLVNPNRPIPKHVQRLTGITPDDVQTAPSLSSALSRFFAFAGNRPLIAHHSRHEREFFRAALWKTSRAKFVHRLLDTMLLLRICDQQLGATSLDALCSRHQINVESRHHALSDAMATAQLWTLYLKQTIQRGFLTLEDVYQHNNLR